MTTLTNQIRLQIAEKSAGSLTFLALLRWAMVIIFLWFGGMKFTAYEAAGIAPFIEHSPIMSWLHALFGVQGASYVIGVIELSTAAALILGAFQPIFSALGAAAQAQYLLLVQVQSIGTIRGYMGVVPSTSPSGYFVAVGQLIDLKTQKLLWHKGVSIRRPGRGEWDQPPDFANLTAAVHRAVDSGIDMLVLDFSWSAK